MELPLESVRDCEIRAVIRFLCAKGENGAQIHRNLTSVYGERCMSLQMVRKWVEQFKNGRVDVHDLQRSGRPTDVNNNDSVAAVLSEIQDNRRVTIYEIKHSLQENYCIDISIGSIHTIIHRELLMRKVCARWVPRNLTEAHKTQRIEAAREFFQRFQVFGDELFNQIVTGDESWVHHYTPETKRQSMSWIGPGESAPKKFKTQHSAGKVMLSVFWDTEGILLEDYLEKGKTVNADYYCELLDKLRRAIENKRRGKLSRGVLLIHDNARPHVAAVTKNRLESFAWEIFSHPPYSPDLAPSDFHLFPFLKAELGGQHFESLEHVKAAVHSFFINQPKDFYARGIKKLATRYQTCLDRGGDYVEK